MAVVPAETTSDIEVFRHHARTIHKVVELNLSGFTQDESLIQPSPGGNCLNWVLGHLVCVYNNMLSMLRQERLMDTAALKRYERGSMPIGDAFDALDIGQLVSAWNEAAKRIDDGLLSLTSNELDSLAPFSPSKNPNETVRSLLATVFFHQAYHAGQTGILRRIAGKEGAIG